MRRLTKDERELKMIDFEKELEKFSPSLEINEVEDSILNSDLTDMSDILRELLNEMEEKR